MKARSTFWLGFLALLVVCGAIQARQYPSFTGTIAASNIVGPSQLPLSVLPSQVLTNTQPNATLSNLTINVGTVVGNLTLTNSTYAIFAMDSGGGGATDIMNFTNGGLQDWQITVSSNQLAFINSLLSSPLMVMSSNNTTSFPQGLTAAGITNSAQTSASYLYTDANGQLLGGGGQAGPFVPSSSGKSTNQNAVTPTITTSATLTNSIGTNVISGVGWTNIVTNGGFLVTNALSYPSGYPLMTVLGATTSNYTGYYDGYPYWSNVTSNTIEYTFTTNFYLNSSTVAVSNSIFSFPTNLFNGACQINVNMGVTGLEVWSDTQPTTVYGQCAGNTCVGFYNQATTGGTPTALGGPAAAWGYSGKMANPTFQTGANLLALWIVNTNLNTSAQTNINVRANTSWRIKY